MDDDGDDDGDDDDDDDDVDVLTLSNPWSQKKKEVMRLDEKKQTRVMRAPQHRYAGERYCNELWYNVPYHLQPK